MIAFAIISIIVFAVLFLTNPVVENKKTITGTESSNRMIEVSVPNIDLAATTGADGSTIYYADEHIFIFAGYYGLFVYDVEANQIVRSVDLAPIGCNFTQGDDACEIFATADGSKVLLRPLSSDMMYVYSVADKDILNQLEAMLSQAEERKGLDCPHNVSLYLYREDGSVGVIYPATDSCDVFYSGGKYYDFGAGDNAEFWNILGLKVEYGMVVSPSISSYEAD